MGCTKKDFVYLNALLFILFSGILGDVSLSSPPMNISVLQGEDATFACSLNGTQATGEDLQFYKTTPAPSTLIGLNSIVRDESKYSVTGTYTYTIHSVTLEDEGRYECVLFPNSPEAYLSVSVPPVSHAIGWSHGSNYVDRGIPTNLTCITINSHPVATHRWFKGDNEITDQAVIINISTNPSGFGNTVSSIELVLTQDDYFAPFRCVASLPGAPDIRTTQIRALFSSDARKTQISDHILLILPITFIFNWIV